MTTQPKTWWEYKVIFIPELLGKDLDVMESFLNAQGSSTWELVSVDSGMKRGSMPGFWGFFKRPTPPPEFLEEDESDPMENAL